VYVEDGGERVGVWGIFEEGFPLKFLDEGVEWS
jgi:hypothetical protein